MSHPYLLLLLALFAVLSARAAVNSPLDVQAVVDAINGYGTDLNYLAEFALGSSCSLSSVNTTALAAASATFVEKYFSTSIRSYTVVQSTAPFAPVTVLNYSVGGAAQAATGVPAFPNSAALYAYLPQAYVGFFNYYFSRPFWWIVDKPIVTAINLFDSEYDGAVTAYITASNVNEGFSCSDLFTATPTRKYTKQQSVYHHVMVLENHGNIASWRFIAFAETNKNQVIFSQLPVQLAPSN